MSMNKYKVLMYDDFNDEQMNSDYWFEFYLPQWSSRELSAPHYIIEDSILKLYIANDQKPWCTEWNGNVKVSNLQTGVFSGPLNSTIGQHHFTEGLVVREVQEKEIKIALCYGTVEFKAKCSLSKENVAALWLIGIEENTEESAEICLFELKGSNVRKDKSVIGYGVHPFGDTSLKDCFYEEEFPIKVEEWNVYALDWYTEGIDFYFNDIFVRRITEIPRYQMQIMLNLYNLGNKNNEQSVFEIDYVKVCQWLY